MPLDRGPIWPGDTLVDQRVVRVGEDALEQLRVVSVGRLVRVRVGVRVEVRFEARVRVSCE